MTGTGQTGTGRATISDAKNAFLRFEVIYASTYDTVWCLNCETEFQHLDAFAFFQYHNGIYNCILTPQFIS